MRIDIYKTENEYVYFTSKYGSACGIWKEKAMPCPGAYDVEIDSEYKVKFHDVCVTSDITPGLNCIDSQIEITSYLYQYDDGCITLKIGDDIAEFITEKNDNFKKICGCNITVTVPQISLYDSHIS